MGARAEAGEVATTCSDAVAAARSYCNSHGELVVVEAADAVVVVGSYAAEAGGLAVVEGHAGGDTSVATQPVAAVVDDADTAAAVAHVDQHTEDDDD